jgi:hypothetical protein
MKGRKGERGHTRLYLTLERDNLPFDLQRDGEGKSGAWGGHLKHNWWGIELTCQGLARKPVRRMRIVKRYAFRGFSCTKCNIFGIPSIHQLWRGSPRVVHAFSSKLLCLTVCHCMSLQIT